MENFGAYIRAGVNMGLGTDTTPHNLVEEMRKAAVLARIAARDIATVTTSDVLHAATIGGARALMRDDLGRIALNGKADLVLVDLTVPQMRPVRDPTALLHLPCGRPRRVRCLCRRAAGRGRSKGADHEPE